MYNKYYKPSWYNTNMRGNTPGDDPNKVNGWYVIERWILSEDFTSMKRDTTILQMDKGMGHGAASMVFGKDGYLYISVSSYSKNGWDLTDMMRKVLRIDVASNDFFQSGGGWPR